ncbi:MAG: transposase [Pseudomonadota bacterium]
MLQIVATVREADAGMKVKEICHQHGVSNATYYKMEIEIRRRESSGREAENAKL